MRSTSEDGGGWDAEAEADADAAKTHSTMPNIIAKTKARFDDLERAILTSSRRITLWSLIVGACISCRG